MQVTAKFEFWTKLIKHNEHIYFPFYFLNIHLNTNSKISGINVVKVEYVWEIMILLEKQEFWRNQFFKYHFYPLSLQQKRILMIWRKRRKI